MARTFQTRVDDWMQYCFGPKISRNVNERNYRFLEESLELVQSLGCSKSDVLKLVEYVYNRPEGNPKQEVGGVIITLAALCLANGIDLEDAGEIELSRIWTKVDVIRTKQLSKRLLMGNNPEEQ